MFQVYVSLTEKQVKKLKHFLRDDGYKIGSSSYEITRKRNDMGPYPDEKPPLLGKFIPRGKEYGLMHHGLILEENLPSRFQYHNWNIKRLAGMAISTSYL